MNISFINYRWLHFFYLILSSLGFLASITLIRFFSSENKLNLMLDIQSSAVLYSFFLQMGYRSSFRNYFFNNRIYDINVAKFYIERLLLLFSMMSLFFFDYLSYSCFFAVLTIRLSISIAECRQVERYCVLIFLVCFIPSLFIFYDIELFYLEILSFFCLFFLILFDSVTISSSKYNFNVFLSTLVDSQSYQVGGLVSIFSTYYLAQTFVNVEQDDGVLSTYADLQVLCGVFVLLIGKIILIFEGRLYSDRKVRLKFYFSSCLLLIFFSLALSLFFYFFDGRDFYLVLFISFVLLSRVLMGYVVQYSSSNVFALFCFSSLFSFYYLALIFSGHYLSVFYQFLSVLIYFLSSFVFLFLSRFNS